MKGLEMVVDNRIYWHKLTTRQQYLFETDRFTVKEIQASFKVPDWCGYGQLALDPMGCWGLVLHRVKNYNYCHSCEFNSYLVGDETY